MIVLAALAAVLLFGVPALITPLRTAAAGRADARAARAAEQEAAADSARAEHDGWKTNPHGRILREYYRFEAHVRTLMTAAVAELKKAVDTAETEAAAVTVNVRAGKPVTPAYRLLALAALGMFAFVVLLAASLEYLIFRAVHPHTTWFLPLGLALLTTVTIVVGSVVAFSAGRHGMLPDFLSPYARRVVTTGGLMLALGGVLYIGHIAPARSAEEGGAAVAAAKALKIDAEATRPVDKALVDSAFERVAAAEADLRRSRQIDVASAVAVAGVEVPLSEGALLGGELVLLGLAKRRANRARDMHRAAEDTLEIAQRRFVADMAARLDQAGHSPQVVFEAMALATPVKLASPPKDDAAAGQKNADAADDDAAAAPSPQRAPATAEIPDNNVGAAASADAAPAAPAPEATERGDHAAGDGPGTRGSDRPRAAADLDETA